MPADASGGPGRQDAATAAREWDARYANGPVWGREPNPWVRREAEQLTPGRALDLAAGDGRHAIWLASLGWAVTAVDISPEGVRLGESLTRDARAAGLLTGPVTWLVGDARAPHVPPGSVDLVVVAYLHLPADDLALALTHAADAVAPGGLAVVVGHDVRNPGEGTGGPQDPAVLTSARPVADALRGRGLEVVRAEVAARAVEGADRPALDTVVVATRPQGPSSRPE